MHREAAAAPAAGERALTPYLRLYRVGDWLHFLPLPLAAWHADPTAKISALLAWACALAYTSAINHAFDDRLDAAAKNPVAGGFGRRRAVLLAIPPGLLALGLLGWGSPQGLVPGAVMLASATVYSAPPRLKRVPVLGTMWNLVVGVPGLFFAGRPPIDELPLRLLVGLFALLLLVSQLIHEAVDRDDDAHGQVRTVATEAGRRAALAAAMVFVLLMPAAAWWLAGGAARRLEVTAASGLFALAWGALLWVNLRCDDVAVLRRLRLGYRWSAIALGTLAFAACYV